MTYNVIYIHSHDSGKFISPYGVNVTTPNLEQFAESSVVFQNAFSVAPTCSPSRASLLSSTYPHENGMLGLVNRGFMMDDYNRHFVRWLNNAGFQTALCGIQHEAAHYHESDKAAQIIGYQNNLTTKTILADLPDKRLWDSENTKQLTSWLENYDSDKKFFVSLGFYGTHRPYPVVKNTDTIKGGVPNGFPSVQTILEDFQEYNESIKHVDQCFGQVIDQLKSLDILKDTIVIFTTDHGIAYPYGKNNLTDLGLEVSLLMHLPGRDKRQDLSQLVSHLDIVPTLCDYLEIEPEFPVRGKSLRSVIEDSKNINEELFFEMNFHTSFEPARAVRTKRYKYIEYLEDYEQFQLSNINDSKVKDFYIENGLATMRKHKKQFFDLYFDPDEKNNLMGNPQYATDITELQSKLQNWRLETKDYQLEQLEWQDHWVVNTRESKKQKGNSVDDYIEGHVPTRLKK